MTLVQLVSLDKRRFRLRSGSRSGPGADMRPGFGPDSLVPVRPLAVSAQLRRRLDEQRVRREGVKVHQRRLRSPPTVHQGLPRLVGFEQRHSAIGRSGRGPGPGQKTLRTNTTSLN